MNAAERLQALERTVEKLREVAVGACIVVEGRKDLAALEALGVGGHHVTVHHGKTIEQVIDELAADAEARQWVQVVLLLDWDRTGGRLMKRLREGLAGRVALDSELRRRFARSAHCKCVEDLPAEISALRRQIV